jgi:uncharacterized protein (TIGR03083 family)
MISDARATEGLTAAVDGFVALDPSTFAQPVEPCPGWTVADVFSHTSRVHRWAARILRSGATERVSSRLDPPLPTEPDELHAAFAEGAAELLTTLAACDLDADVWAWTGAREPGRWWLRRQLHETIVHLWDAQVGATGSHTTIDGELGADGVDELLSVYLPLVPGGAFPVDATVHVHATDVAAEGGGEWLLRGTGDGIAVTREHAKGDVAARGPATDLLALLWGRPTIGTVEVFGDASVLDQLRAATTF